jgi:uncharacterized protein (DUF983 family)
MKVIESDLVPPRNHAIIGVCPDCVKARLPPKPTRLCERCLKCGDIHCQCETPELFEIIKNKAVLSEPPFFNIIS